ncbi:unnamed protein product [Protopolystoma xenopodis]|uniref:Uncharacterized protein n=1 Tax=Protopolystoma xenopodis TaxID=117903 RepID=A0A3S5BJI5_9PLAT|nr:unnamed protein product [Protopolystoma xenopodis]
MTRATMAKLRNRVTAICRCERNDLKEGHLPSHCIRQPEWPRQAGLAGRLSGNVQIQLVSGAVKKEWVRSVEGATNGLEVDDIIFTKHTLAWKLNLAALERGRIGKSAVADIKRRQGVLASHTN